MMKALVYTGVEKMEFREEKEPSEKPGESILKVHASAYVAQICMLTTEKTREEFHL